LEGFETPEGSSIANETFTPSPKRFKMFVTYKIPKFHIASAVVAFLITSEFIKKGVV
jgi:hypothetical protein